MSQGATQPIEVSGLAKRFGAFAAVSDLDLTVERGQVHGFLGPNGAGKSTTIRVLLGLYRASAGRVRVMGLDPARHAAEVTRQVSYVPGEVALWPNLTGREVLDALAGLRGRRDREAERRLINDFALDPSKLVRAYSKGNRQKVVLVAALAAPTDLLVLDEPTSGLDPLMEQVFQSAVRTAAAAGRSVLLSSHVLSEVEDLCGSVTIIKDGRLVESGRLADMRHLAASQITAKPTPRQWSAVIDALDELAANGALESSQPRESTIGRINGPGEPAASDEVRLGVAREHVPRVLAALARLDVSDITCTPASLEDLFLSHYEAAPR